MYQQGSMHAYWPSEGHNKPPSMSKAAIAQSPKSDSSHEGGVTLGAFLLMAAMANAPLSSLQEGFNAFDANKDGFITLEVGPYQYTSCF